MNSNASHNLSISKEAKQNTGLRVMVDFGFYFVLGTIFVSLILLAASKGADTGAFRYVGF